MLALTVKVKLQMTSSNAQNVVLVALLIRWLNWSQITTFVTVVVYNNLIKAIVEQDQHYYFPPETRIKLQLLTFNNSFFHVLFQQLLQLASIPRQLNWPLNWPWIRG